MTVGITELPPEGMQLGGVALAGDADRGTKTTEGLSLLFTTAGITVQGPQPQIERLLVWSGLDSASCREKIDLPDGRNAAVMELTSGGQSIRFLLPMDAVTPGQAAYLDQALPAWLARYKGTAAPVVPAPAPAGAFANGGPPSSSGQSLGGSGAGPTPAPGPAAPPVAPSPDGAPAESPVAPAAAAGAAAAAAGGIAASSSNGTVRGAGDSGSGTTGTAGPTGAPAPPAPPAFGSPAGQSPSDGPGAPGPDAGAQGADPATSSFVARSATGSLPPSAARRRRPAPPDAPPPPPGLVGADAPPAATGWATPTEPLAEPTGWGNPPRDRAAGRARPIRPSGRDPGGRAVRRPNPRGRRPSSSRRCGRRPNRRPTPPPSS